MILSRLAELTATAAHEPQAVTEARREGDLMSLIEKWQDANKIHSYEGSRGERNFTKLVSVLGYRDLSSFFEDNSGAFEALVEWIGSMRNTEWVEAFQSATEDDSETDEEDDE